VAVNQTLSFLGAFANLRKATIRFVISLLPCPSVRTEQLDSDWTDFYEIWYLNIFENLSKIFKFHYNVTGTTGMSHEDQYTFMIISRSVLRRMRNVSDKSCRENQNTLLYSVPFFKSCLLWDNVEKYCRAGQATDDNYKHTLRICNTYCFLTATMVAQTQLDIALYVHCLACYMF